MQHDLTGGRTAALLVDVGGGRRLCARVRGAGPVVVMSGGGAGEAIDVSPFLDSMEEQIARFATVVTYDRSGVGRSDGPFPATLASVVRDVHALVRGLDLTLPAVFAGWSFGGLVAEAYAATYPSDVCGLVLIDPTQTSAAELPRLQRMLGERISRFAMASFHFLAATGLAATSPGQTLLRRTVRTASPAVRDAAMRFYSDKRRLSDMRKLLRHLYSQVEEAARLVEARGLPPVPLTVISAGRHPGMRAKAVDFQRRDHQALAARSPLGRRVVAERSTHQVPMDQPEIIVDEIRAMLTAPPG